MAPRLAAMGRLRNLASVEQEMAAAVAVAVVVVVVVAMHTVLVGQRVGCRKPRRRR